MWTGFNDQLISQDGEGFPFFPDSRKSDRRYPPPPQKKKGGIIRVLLYPLPLCCHHKIKLVPRATSKDTVVKGSSYNEANYLTCSCGHKPRIVIFLKSPGCRISSTIRTDPKLSTISLQSMYYVCI